MPVRAAVVERDPVIEELYADSASRFTFVDDFAIEEEAPLEWLVDGVLEVGAFGVLYSLSDSYKTFVGIDWAFSIATGIGWHGRPVKRGRVLYVVGEGRRGIGRRGRAWKLVHGVAGFAGVYFLTVPVQFMDADEVAELLAAIRKLPEPPVLIIIDTMARCLVGGNENDAKDVGVFIHGVDRLRAATGSAVLVIHHSGKQGGQERGSSALRGAADTMIFASREDEIVTLTNTAPQGKQKDAAAFEPIRLRAKVVKLGDGQTSLALEDITEDPAPIFASAPLTLPRSRQDILDALVAIAGPEGITYSAWKKAAMERARCSETTFMRGAKELVDWDRVEKSGSRYSIKGTFK